jgi:hypothetical protein
VILQCCRIGSMWSVVAHGASRRAVTMWQNGKCGECYCGATLFQNGKCGGDVVVRTMVHSENCFGGVVVVAVLQCCNMGSVFQLPRCDRILVLPCCHIVQQERHYCRVATIC